MSAACNSEEHMEPAELSPILEQCSEATVSPDTNDNIPLIKKRQQDRNVASLHLQPDNLNEKKLVVDVSSASSVVDEQSLTVDDMAVEQFNSPIANNHILRPSKSAENVYKCMRVTPREARLISEAHLLNQVQKLCRALYEHFLERKFEHCVGESVFMESHKVVRDELGFSLERRRSRLANGGMGVFVSSGIIPKKQLVAFYPGTVYSPGDSVFVQSIANPFVFRCVDGFLVDGNDKYLSKVLYRSCSFRDRIGKYMCSDMTWLTDRPLNPLAVGQYVNNATDEHCANVSYQEANLPLEHFPLDYRRFIPNIWYNSSDGGHAHMRLVLLVSTRDIHTGEELYSNYFTVLSS